MYNFPSVGINRSEVGSLVVATLTGALRLGSVLGLVGLVSVYHDWVE